MHIYIYIFIYLFIYLFIISLTNSLNGQKIFIRPWMLAKNKFLEILNLRPLHSSILAGAFILGTRLRKF